MAIFDVIYSVTGDCSSQNNGAISLTISGNAPDYRIEYLSPILPTTYLTNYDVDYTITGLSAGTYVLSVKDSSALIIDPSITGLTDTQSAYTFSVNISSGTCLTISTVRPTRCGGVNGSLTVSTPFSYGPSVTFDLYDINDNLIESQSNTNNPPSVTFSNLPVGIYYVIADDGGGCLGRSESVVIRNSNNIDFGFYVVNNSACYGNLGKIYITGLTGTPPYTYLWSNGETTDFITGLTAGIYSVQVTDALGCTTFPKFATVDNADPLEIISVITQNPDCNNPLGSITLEVSGGSPPYNFSGSNGVTQLVFSNTYTFENLAGGNYEFLITDAGLCNAYKIVTLLPSNSFVLASVDITNSNCNGFGGEITVYLLGAGSFTYTLTDSNGSTKTLQSGNSVIFQNLNSGTYTLEITHNVPGGCTYTGTYTVTNTPPFEVFAIPTDTTCAKLNGSVEIQIVGSGQTPYTVEVTGKPPLSGIYFSSVTMNNLSSGVYDVRVIDNNGCVNGTSFYIDSSTNVDFIVTYLNNSLYLNIIQGTPPFTITWGSPYQNETGLVINNVSSGNYSVTVLDSLGCLRTRNQEVEGLTVTTGSSTINLCTNVFSQGQTTNRSISKMFFEGYTQLIQNEINCKIDSAFLTAEVIVSGESKTEVFYSADTLNLPPNIDDIWVSTIVGLLDSFYGIGDIFLDIPGNQITINTDCNLPADLLAGSQVIINLYIDYEISCDFCSFVFQNCCDPTDRINVGILYDNFDIGDTIELNGSCYSYTGDPGFNTPSINRLYPDFYNSVNPCEDCKQSQPIPPCP